MNAIYLPPETRLSDVGWIRRYHLFAQKYQETSVAIAKRISAQVSVEGFQDTDTYKAQTFKTDLNTLLYKNVYWRISDFLWYANHYKHCGALLNVVVTSDLPGAGKSYFMAAQTAMLRHALWTTRPPIKTKILNAFEFVESAVKNRSDRDIIPYFIKTIPFLALDDFDTLLDYRMGNMDIFQYIMRSLLKYRADAHLPTMLSVSDHNRWQAVVEEYKWMQGFGQFSLEESKNE